MTSPASVSFTDFISNGENLKNTQISVARGRTFPTWIFPITYIAEQTITVVKAAQAVLNKFLCRHIYLVSSLQAKSPFFHFVKRSTW